MLCVHSLLAKEKFINTTDTTAKETRYTCPETGVTILADWLAGEYGSPNGLNGNAAVVLVQRENRRSACKDADADDPSLNNPSLEQGARLDAGAVPD